MGNGISVAEEEERKEQRLLVKHERLQRIEKKAAARRTSTLDVASLFDRLWLRTITREELTKIVVREYRNHKLTPEQLQSIVRTAYTSMR